MSRYIIYSDPKHSSATIVELLEFTVFMPDPVLNIAEWARVDPSIYAQCFTGQAINSENWWTRCQYLDHTTSNCPYCPKKKQWSSTGGGEVAIPPGRSSRFASNTSSLGTASLGKNAGISTYAVRAESPILSHVVVQESGGVSNQ